MLQIFIEDNKDTKLLSMRIDAKKLRCPVLFAEQMIHTSRK